MVTRTRSVPQIVVSTADYERLNDLANASMERLPDVAEELLAEMERAKVVDGGKVPGDVVRMGSTVTFTSDDGPTRHPEASSGRSTRASTSIASR